MQIYFVSFSAQAWWGVTSCLFYFEDWCSLNLILSLGPVQQRGAITGSTVDFMSATSNTNTKMLESRPEDALAKLVKIVTLVKLVKPWRLY